MVEVTFPLVEGAVVVVDVVAVLDPVEESLVVVAVVVRVDGAS